MFTRVLFLSAGLTGSIAAHAVAATSPAFTDPAHPSGPAALVVALAPPLPGAALRETRGAFECRARGLGLAPLGTLAERVGSSEDPSPFAKANGLRELRAPARHPFDLAPERVLLLGAADEAALAAARRALAADPAVEWLEPAWTRELCEFPADGSLPDDPLFRATRQWGLWNAGPAGVMGGTAGADIGARDAWALGTGAAALRLAIADTGVDPVHPDLQSPLPEGPRLFLGCNLAEPRVAWADSNGHGTAVAGVMAALTHDGSHFDSLGIAGVCGGDGAGNPGGRLIPIRITAGGYGYTSSFQIAAAIVYATRAGARVLNLSFAGSGDSRLERQALYYATTRGCTVVVASGNRGAIGPGVSYPAAYAAEGLCVAVGASDPGDRRAAFSSYGAELDLVAPGVDVWTTAPTYPNAFGARWPGYLSASGTSFAAPHVAGAIGLMAARRPDLADRDFQALVRRTARDLAPAGRDDETGWGRLDAAAAMRACDPAYALLHDEVAAEVRPTGIVRPLVVVADSFGTFDRSSEWNGRPAELFEAVATFTLPERFADEAEIWPRVGGTMALRGDFRLAHWAPWAAIGREGRRVTLRGYLYRVPMIAAGIEFEPDSADAWLPLPPDQARFGFTVFGPMTSRAPLAMARPAPVPAVRVAPNPARGTARLSGPPGARIAITDVGGRLVHAAVLDARGAQVWDARGPGGARASPGLYFVRTNDARERTTRFVLLE